MMSFGEAIATCLRKYATFSGRARRPEYWWFVLFNVLVGVATSIVDIVLFGLENTISPVNLIASLALLAPNLAVGWRRMHDVGKPGYYSLLVVFAMVPAGALLFLGVSAAPDLLQVFGFAAIAIVLAAAIYVFVLVVSKTQPGANEYGAEPGSEVQVDGVFE